MATTTLTPSLLPKERLATALDAPVSQVREWMHRGVIRPVERTKGNAGAALFGRDDLNLGAVLRALQDVLGEKSPLPFELAPQIRSMLSEWAQWNELPRGHLPILVTRDNVSMLVLVHPRVIADVVRRLRDAA